MRRRPFKHWLDDWPRMARQIAPVTVPARPHYMNSRGRARTWEEVRSNAALAMFHHDYQTALGMGLTPDLEEPDYGNAGFTLNSR